MIRLAEPQGAIDSEVINAVVETLKGGGYINGENVRKFEEEFASFVGAKYAVATSSGTSALHLALLSLGIRSGEWVVTTPLSFIATTNAIRYVGAKPVFADVDPETGNINPDNVEYDVMRDPSQPHPVAILPVHLHGCPAEMDSIMEIAEARDLLVVEDAAQAHGAEYRGKKVGSFGDVGCFSFWPSKAMTVCGNAGMLVTDDEDVAEKARTLRDQGEKPKHVHNVIGYNYRFPSEFHATIGRIELKRLPEWIKKRRENASLYSKLMEGITEVKLPREKQGAKAVPYMYVVRVKEREKLRNYLMSKEIETGIHYPFLITQQKPYLDFGGRFPVAEKLAGTFLSLPCHQFLNDENVEYVSRTIREFYGK